MAKALKKTCSTCSLAKPESNFYGNGIYLRSTCKECDKTRNRKYFKERYYPAHREELIQKVIATRKEKTPKS